MKVKATSLLKNAEEELAKIKEISYKDIVLDQEEQKTIVKWLISFIELISKFRLSTYNYKRFLDQIKNPVADIRWIMVNAEAILEYIKDNPEIKLTES